MQSVVLVLYYHSFCAKYGNKLKQVKEMISQKEKGIIPSLALNDIQLIHVY